MSTTAGAHGHPALRALVVGVILLNLAVALCSEIDHPHEQIWALLEAACLVFFGAEMLAKMLAERAGFWRSRWNLFDLTVIVLAALPLLVVGADLGVLRVARAARIFHLGRHVSNLRLLACATHLVRRAGGLRVARAVKSTKRVSAL